MAIQHSDITNANCHEPLHITASATSDSGKVITPSGTTSGTSELRQLIFEDLNIAGSTDGEMKPFGFYADATYTSGSELSLVATTRTKLTIDGLNPSTTEVDMPSGVSFWDSVTNKITPEYKNDCYDLRLQMKASTVASGGYLTADLDIGGSIGIVTEETRPILKTSATNRLIFSWPIFCLDTFAANGGEFYVTASDATDIWDVAVYIVRTRKGGAS